MPNVNLLLENDIHLLPLLRKYLSYIDSEIQNKQILNEQMIMDNILLAPEQAFGEEDYEYIQNPDGTASGFKLDVLSEGNGGSDNLRDGFWRLIAGCLKNGFNPEKVRCISIINDFQGSGGTHWTAAVAEFTLEPEFLNMLRSGLPDDISNYKTFEIINEINKNAIFESTNINNNYTIPAGVSAVQVQHYDSHIPNNEDGHYYKAYKETLEPWINANEKITVEVSPADCKKQKGNTCGDNAIFNGFVAGVLGLDPSAPEHQIDSDALRAFSEAHIDTLQSTTLRAVSEAHTDTLQSGSRAFSEEHVDDLNSDPSDATLAEEAASHLSAMVEKAQTFNKKSIDFIALKNIAKDVHQAYQNKRHSGVLGILKYFSKERAGRENQIELLQQSLNNYINHPTENNQTALAGIIKDIRGAMEQEQSQSSYKLGKSGLNDLMNEIENHLNSLSSTKPTSKRRPQ